MPANFEAAKQYVLTRLAQELPTTLYYHAIHHTRDDVLPAAQRLGQLAELNEHEAMLLHTAAVYHDLGYIQQYELNEPIAVRIAAATLPDFGYNPDEITLITGMIMATRMPQKPTNQLERLLCDADLDSLGRMDMLMASHALRTELRLRGQEISLRDWYLTQLKFIADHTYHTPEARQLRDAQKQQNVDEIAKLLMQVGVDYIGVGVGAMIFNEQGQVFMAQRGAQATNERGTWEFPGGKVDFGDTLADTIQREFMEEYGMEIQLAELLTVNDHILPEEAQHWVSPTYIGKHIGGEPHILEPAKCSDIGWFALDALPEPMSMISQADMKVYCRKYSAE